MFVLIIDILAALLLGSMLFFAAIVAPSAFKALPPEQSGLFLRTVFPRYFLWGIVLSAVTLIVCLLHSPKGSALMALVLAGFIYARQILAPKTNDARDKWNDSDSPTDKARFNSLHRRSVLINIAQMVLLAIVIIAFSFKQ